MADSAEPIDLGEKGFYLVRVDGVTLCVERAEVLRYEWLRLHAPADRPFRVNPINGVWGVASMSMDIPLRALTRVVRYA